VEQEQEKKEGKGCFSPGCLVIALAAIALIGYGFVMPGKTLPVISLSAELIPIHLPIPGFENGIPNTLPTAIFTSLFLIVIALFYNRAVKRAEKTGKESRFLITIDMIYEGVFSFIETTVGREKATIFFPLIGSFFFFILFANWSGLLPGMGSIGIWHEHHGHLELIPIFRSPTADLSTTVGLAIITQVSAQYYGFKFQGRKYLKKYFNSFHLVSVCLATSSPGKYC
jgi:F-type H+-transporting ATPase subunit a